MFPLKLQNPSNHPRAPPRNPSSPTHGVAPQLGILKEYTPEVINQWLIDGLGPGGLDS